MKCETCGNKNAKTVTIEIHGDGGMFDDQTENWMHVFKIGTRCVRCAERTYRRLRDMEL